MKRHIAFLLCLFTVSSVSVPVWGQDDSNILKENLEAGATKDIGSIMQESAMQSSINIISKQQVDKIQEAVTKINLLDKSDKMKWFLQYKTIQSEYSDWIDPDETIYDYFDDSELDLLFHIVETEVRGEEHFVSKVNVASVIFNRMKHDDFPNSLSDILTEYPQFSSYMNGAYKTIEPTETTILACEYAFQIGDTTNGALYFDSTSGNSWAKRNRNYIFTDSVGHDFYK